MKYTEAATIYLAAGESIGGISLPAGVDLTTYTVPNAVYRLSWAAGTQVLTLRFACSSGILTYPADTPHQIDLNLEDCSVGVAIDTIVSVQLYSYDQMLRYGRFANIKDGKFYVLPYSAGGRPDIIVPGIGQGEAGGLYAAPGRGF